MPLLSTSYLSILNCMVLGPEGLRCVQPCSLHPVCSQGCLGMRHKTVTSTGVATTWDRAFLVTWLHGSRVWPSKATVSHCSAKRPDSPWLPSVTVKVWCGTGASRLRQRSALWNRHTPNCVFSGAVGNLRNDKRLQDEAKLRKARVLW